MGKPGTTDKADDVRQALEEYAAQVQTFSGDNREYFAPRAFGALRKVLDACEDEVQAHQGGNYGGFYAAIQVRAIREVITAALGGESDA